MNIKISFHKIATRLFFLLKTRTYKKRIKYIYETCNSKKLIISFTAFSDKPCFNYYRTLKPLSADKLFLQDNFGYKGSYLLYENGTELPNKLTTSLLNQILTKTKYKEIVTLGTSKGGSDAIIYGLKIGATSIISGANQYYIGKYLNTDVDNRRDIFYAMMGENAGEEEQKTLDLVMPSLFKEYFNSKSHIYLLYSKSEHTYEEHIKDMVEDLKKTNIQFSEIVEDFDDHNDVGKFFIPYITKQLGI